MSRRITRRRIAGAATGAACVVGLAASGGLLAVGPVPFFVGLLVTTVVVTGLAAWMDTMPGNYPDHDVEGWLTAIGRDVEVESTSPEFRQRTLARWQADRDQRAAALRAEYLAAEIRGRGAVGGSDG